MRRTLLSPLLRAVMSILLCLAFAAQAQEFPKGPVKIIVPFPPGGPTDTVARLIGQKLEGYWGQPVIIDYKPGAGTVIGVDFVAKSLPDGYTMVMINSAFAVNPSLRKTMPYNTLKDLVGVSHIADLQLAIVARNDAPFNTVAELIAYGKKNPGKLTYGTPGAGSTTHLGAELLKRTAGFDMLHSPFKGSAPAQAELMGGRIDLIFDPYLSVQPFVKAGRMKMIATEGLKRIPGTDYPTVAETIPGFSVNALLAFEAAAGTPKPILHKIAADTARALNEPDMKKRVEDLGMASVGSTPEQLDAFIATEIKRWAKVVADANIQPE
ncbi:MAG: transporter [Betaproteobacteria bacterium]|nr:transporter [Betaproteobacteria bacterium]